MAITANGPCPTATCGQLREVYETRGRPAAGPVGSERVRRDFSWRRAATIAHHLLEKA